MAATARTPDRLTRLLPRGRPDRVGMNRRTPCIRHCQPRGERAQAFTISRVATDGTGRGRRPATCNAQGTLRSASRATRAFGATCAAAHESAASGADPSESDDQSKPRGAQAGTGSQDMQGSGWCGLRPKYPSATISPQMALTRHDKALQLIAASVDVAATHSVWIAWDIGRDARFRLRR